MEEYDIVIIGGGIAGSVAAKFAAQGGLKVLMVERYKTPREKPCSGIQFPYFQRIIGETIPKNQLCKVRLNKVKIYLPNGKSIGSPFGMLNFMRKPFDHWLNTIAQERGAKFRDECMLKDFEEFEDYVDIQLLEKDESITAVRTRYLLDATGLRPKIRMKLRPNDFKGRPSGATLNYYINGTANLNPNTLYQFWNIDWNDAMFAWIYMKTLDDGNNYWVVGTGCNTGKVIDRQTLFYDYVKQKFNIQGEIIKKEGFSITIDMNSKERIWLGENRILMVGDAAGLIDQVRGVGIDAAALSGRFAAMAILEADKKKTKAIDEYKRLTTKIVAQTKRNQNREINVFTNNDQLQEHLNKNIIKMGLGIIFHGIINNLRSLEDFVLLPP